MKNTRAAPRRTQIVLTDEYIKDHLLLKTKNAHFLAETHALVHDAAVTRIQDKK
jgi:hypothetical protein